MRLMQAECEDLAKQEKEAQQRLTKAQDQYAGLQRRRVTLSTRAADTEAALAAAKAATLAAGVGAGACAAAVVPTAESASVGHW
eukprot:jgi/Ulvmu1/10095/UM006_0042.1